ncbi:uncharacterized protein Sec16 [Fopius arisanus]|uniref:Uncharacterized protein Sec16 n=1 Tax=Fopius arisanus TaxID=64838 RepID=A0A9R1TM81_9HYME|nr:PREDICTED: uncharacterized protein LOC105271924 [Fopius arisanus]
MNNPYRARPGRPRVDPLAVANYGTQNKSVQPQMPGEIQPREISTTIQSNVLQPPQYAEISSQPNKAGDPWDWGNDNLDNGNDAWNWSVDQTHETHMQEPGVSKYLNSGQTIQTPLPDNYHNNSNGNNRPVPPRQQILSSAGGNLPRTGSHVSTPNFSQDPYSRYSNCDEKLQQRLQSPCTVPSTQLSSCSSALNANNEQVLWGQTMHKPFYSTSFDMSKNTGFHYAQQHKLEKMNEYERDSRIEKYNLTSEETSYNEVQSTAVSSPAIDWQNSITEENSVRKVNNQCAQASQEPDNCRLNRVNNLLMQKSEDLKMITLDDSPSLTSSSQSLLPPNVAFTVITQQLPQTNRQWENARGGIRNQLHENPLQGVNKIAAAEWQHGGHPMHFSQPQVSRTTFTHEAEASSLPVSKLSDTQLPLVPPSAKPLEGSLINNSVNEHRKANNIVGINDLSSSMNQITINESYKLSNQQIETQPLHFQNVMPESHRPSQLSYSAAQSVEQQHSTNNNSKSQQATITSPSSSQTQDLSFNESSRIQMISTLEATSRANKPIPPTNIVRPVQEQDVLPPQQRSMQNQNIDRGNISEHTNYDQWYNNSSTQVSQLSSASQNVWNSSVSELHLPLQGDWTPPQVSTSEPSIDTCASIQPPAESNLIAIREETRSEFQRSEVDTVSVSQLSHFQHPSIEQELLPSESYEFASNDRNTFLETGELTDSHHDQECVAPNQDEDNDEVPNDIPFLREVPGQSSNSEQSRNDPTGQEQYIIPTAGERRDMPPGQECLENDRLIRDTGRVEPDPLERRNDPSGREKSLPPVQPRNHPSGQERITPIQPIPQIYLEPNKVRQVPGTGTNNIDAHLDLVNMDNGIRRIPGGISPTDATVIESLKSDGRNDRVVTGSQEYSSISAVLNIQETREEAIGASTKEKTTISPASPKRRDSYEDGDDEESGNSRDESRERRERRDLRDSSPLALENRRRYDRNYYEHDRDREFDEDYYYDRRRPDYDRPYNSREDLDRRDASYRNGDRGHRVEDNDDPGRRGRGRSEEERDSRPVGKRDELRNQRDRSDDNRRRDRERDVRDYYMRDGRDIRDPRIRDFPDSDRRRRRFDEYDRDHRREYYDDPYSRSSRPSSRSSYNDRERDYYLRPRDPYYGYNNGYAGYDYGVNYNANYYAYLENLRRTNPAAYIEWYNKYYLNHPHHQQLQPKLSQTLANYSEDRASVHSGQSSCDDRTASGKLMAGDISLIEDSRITSRMTPTKFSTSHAQGLFSIGSLMYVHASYPTEGERAKVDIVSIDGVLLHDPIVRELRSYPGPLIKGVTHKKTIIEYCESKINKAAANDKVIDRASYVLLYQLMIMLIQQNGNVVGVDIAALLLRNKESYPYDANASTQSKEQEFTQQSSTVCPNSSTSGNESPDETHLFSKQIESQQQSKQTVEQITNEFRKTLLNGLIQEALEYAMSEGLWGHALFLASKLEKRTHATVMTRFANSLSPQDPLQTLYQLHSGRVPASVTCIADCKWDDWRPHLAMIISNTSGNPEINHRSISTMGDTLAARGDLYAAHFCYILAEIDFGNYGKLGTKIVLIGANHNKHYADFVTLEAVMLTEIYEYARSLSEPSFMIMALQTFKFENALNMIDYGLVEKGLLYLEQIAINIVNTPSKFKPTFIADIYKLSERLKFHDPVFKDSTENGVSLTWLDNLSELVIKYETGELMKDGPHETQLNQEQIEMQQNTQQNQWVYSSNPPEYGNAAISTMEISSVDSNQGQWQPLLNHDNIQYAGSSVDKNNYQSNQPQLVPQQPHQGYWTQQQIYNHEEFNDWQLEQGDQAQNHQSEQIDVDSAQPNNAWNYESEKEEKPTAPGPQPRISMGPSSDKQYDPLEELDAMEPLNSKKSVECKTSGKPNEKKNSTASSGSWFGGFFSKLTPKPRNQMILPDDSNPTIIWDPIAKKWTNKDEGNESASLNLAPPPKATDMSFQPSQVEFLNHSQQAPNIFNSEEATTPNSSKMIGGNNMFKLQKGRGMRANYIDVMNPNVAKGNIPSIPTPATSPLVPMAASSPQMFIPASVNDPKAPLNFLTPMTTSIPPQENAPHGMDSDKAGPK